MVFPTDPNLPEEVVTSPAFCQERLAGFHPQGAPFEIPYAQGHLNRLWEHEGSPAG